jgi:hypothetical protein
VRTPGGDFIIDSDAQVQATMKTIFDRFRLWGSISGLLKLLARDQIKMPVRPQYDPERDDPCSRTTIPVTLSP